MGHVAGIVQCGTEEIYAGRTSTTWLHPKPVSHWPGSTGEMRGLRESDAG